MRVWFPRFCVITNRRQYAIEKYPLLWRVFGRWGIFYIKNVPKTRRDNGGIFKKE
jgi:hypothetical protein